jgi:hypothetical protein
MPSLGRAVGRVPVAVEELERRARHMIGPGAAGDGTVAAAGAPYCRRTAWNAAEAALKRVISTAGSHRPLGRWRQR